MSAQAQRAGEQAILYTMLPALSSGFPALWGDFCPAREKLPEAGFRRAPGRPSPGGGRGGTGPLFRPAPPDGAGFPGQSSSLRTAMKASWGTSTVPSWRIRFLPSFCFSSSFFFRVMSPP